MINDQFKKIHEKHNLSSYQLLYSRPCLLHLEWSYENVINITMSLCILNTINVFLLETCIYYKSHLSWNSIGIFMQAINKGEHINGLCTRNSGSLIINIPLIFKSANWQINEHFILVLSHHGINPVPENIKFTLSSYTYF